MKNKKFIFISLLILAIGFAAVSTTLYISGNLVFGTNKNDFDIYFSGAIIDDEDKTNEVILSDKKHIEYETKELKKLWISLLGMTSLRIRTLGLFILMNY